MISSREIVAAFLTGISKCNSNMNTDGITLYFNGNKIAEKVGRFISIFDGGFPSRSTKYRLNTLSQLMLESGEYHVTVGNIYQRDFQWFFKRHDFTFGGFFRNDMLAGMKK